MCGICGIYNYKNNRPVAEADIRKMNQALYHRGPDDEGYHFNQNLGMGMRRLSIIDLAGGHQPIYNEDRSIALVYNGEIYNFRELRQTLEQQGHKFRTNTDTEVIVHLYEQQQEQFLELLEGMFALALWDERQKKLLLARDHFGIKPLYYAETEAGILFSSEIKSLLVSGQIGKGLDYQVVDEYFSLYYTTAPGTMFKNIRKIVPAHYHAYTPLDAQVQKYWQLSYVSSPGITVKEYEEELIRLLRESVKKNLISDVPLGIFLSGGLDSTAILASMHETAGEQIKSFSLGYSDNSFDETREIQNLVKRYKTEHHEIKVDSAVMSRYLPLAIKHLGEPTGDWTCALWYFLSEFSRPKVKVVLTGAGGDEIFAGYPTLTAYRLARLYERFPAVLRRNIIDKIVASLPVAMTNLSFDYKAKLFVRGAGYDPLRAHFSWKEIFTAEEKKELFSEELYSNIREPDGLEIFRYYLKDLPEEQDWISKLLYLDMKIFLGGNCLPHIDASIMANSQEGRVPLLNHKLVEFAAAIPPDLKHHGFTTKYIFRRALKNMLPREIISKKKMGFSSPMSRWIKDDLTDFVDEYLIDNIVVNRYFKKDYVAGMIRQHRANKKDNGRKIACLVSFMIWEKIYGGANG